MAIGNIAFDVPVNFSNVSYMSRKFPEEIMFDDLSQPRKYVGQQPPQYVP